MLQLYIISLQALSENGLTIKNEQLINHLDITCRFAYMYKFKLHFTYFNFIVVGVL